MVGVMVEPASVAAVTAAEQAAIDELLPTEEDLLYEEELLRNPYSLKMWCRYIEARQGIVARRRYVLYERALKALPGSYKVRSSCAPSAWHHRQRAVNWTSDWASDCCCAKHLRNGHKSSGMRPPAVGGSRSWPPTTSSVNPRSSGRRTWASDGWRAGG